MTVLLYRTLTLNEIFQVLKNVLCVHYDYLLKDKCNMVLLTLYIFMYVQCIRNSTCPYTYPPIVIAFSCRQSTPS